MQLCFVTTNNMLIYSSIIHTSQKATEETNPIATIRISKYLSSYMVANSASPYFVYGPKGHTPDCSMTCQIFPWKFLLRYTQFHPTFLPSISCPLLPSFMSNTNHVLRNFVLFYHQLARYNQEIFCEIYSSI